MALEEELRTIMRRWVTSVTVVAAHAPSENNAPRGMTVSSFTSVSLNPPLILVCLHKEARAAIAVVESGVFGVSILAEDQPNLSARFAGLDPQFPTDADRFQGLTVQQSLTGAPLLTEALSCLDCRVWAVYDGSTHHIVVGEVVAVFVPAAGDERQPLVYHDRTYHRMIPL